MLHNIAIIPIFLMQNISLKQYFLVYLFLENRKNCIIVLIDY